MDRLLSPEKSPRLSEIRGLTAVLLYDHTPLERGDIAEFLDRAENYLSELIARTRRQLGGSAEWRGFYADLTAETPPELSLLDQYLAGFCHAYDVPPDVITQLNPKDFIKEARQGLIYRLQEETPIPLQALAERFGFGVERTTLVETRYSAEEIFAQDPEALRRIMAIERSARLPAESRPARKVVDGILQEAGAAWADLQSPRRGRELLQARRRIVRQLYFRSPMAPQEIAEILHRTPEHVSQIAKEMEASEGDDPVVVKPERVYERESERVSLFFGMPVAGYEKDSGPHLALLQVLTDRGLTVTEIARCGGANRTRVPQFLARSARRRSEDPFFRQLVEAVDAGVEPPGGNGLIEAVLEASANLAGTTVETLHRHPKQAEGSVARDWAAYLLRKRVGLKTRHVQEHAGLPSPNRIRKGVERVSEEIARSEEAAALERFVWRCLLGNHLAPEQGDAVLYFAHGLNRQVRVGRVKEVHEEAEGRLLIINGHRHHAKHTAFAGDPSVLDAEAAAVVMREPNALDLWLTSHRVGPSLGEQMRQALRREPVPGNGNALTSG
jgi:hypothetical protein